MSDAPLHEYRILRHGEEVGLVEAQGQLSALVGFGAKAAPLDHNAYWVVEPTTSQGGTMTDKEMLDWLAAQLNGASYTANADAFQDAVRAKIRSTGRECADLAPVAPDPEPSGY